MFTRNVRAALIPALAAWAVVVAVSTFAGPPQPGTDAKAAKPETDRTKFEQAAEGLHMRLRGLLHVRHQAVKAGDVETVRKVDGLMEGMTKTIDGAFPNLMRDMDRLRAEEKERMGDRGGDKRMSDDARKTAFEGRARTKADRTRQDGQDKD